MFYLHTGRYYRVIVLSTIMFSLFIYIEYKVTFNNRKFTINLDEFLTRVENLEINFGQMNSKLEYIDDRYKSARNSLTLVTTKKIENNPSDNEMLFYNVSSSHVTRLATQTLCKHNFKVLVFNFHSYITLQ